MKNHFDQNVGVEKRNREFDIKVIPREECFGRKIFSLKEAKPKFNSVQN